MSTYTQILYQVVFSTKFRKPELTADIRRDVFACMYGVLKNNKCHTYRIGGVEDHVHLVFSLNPAVALANLIKDVKLASTHYVKKEKGLKKFIGWQNGYGAFTYSIEAKDNLIEYVKNQEQHHAKSKQTFKEEYIELLTEFNVDFDIKFLD
jgi:putative transposase